MSGYRPGTLDDMAVTRRWEQKRRQRLAQANMPTGSQVYATTEKVRDRDDNITALIAMVGDLDSKVDETVQSVEAAMDAVESTVSELREEVGDEMDALRDELEGALADVKPNFPVGSIVWLTDSTPEAVGLSGTWILRTRAFLPLADGTLYGIYERTA